LKVLSDAPIIRTRRPGKLVRIDKIGRNDNGWRVEILSNQWRNPGKTLQGQTRGRNQSWGCFISIIVFGLLLFDTVLVFIIRRGNFHLFVLLRLLRLMVLVGSLVNVDIRFGICPSFRTGIQINFFHFNFVQ